MGTFGDRLRREREMRGVSLDEIAKATKIGTRSLKALEQEDFGKLPGGIFNKGFVRSYAKFLGMDEDQAVADYMVAAGEAEKSSDAVMERLAAQSERRAEEKRIQRQREDNAGPPFTWNTVAVVVIVIVAAVLGWEYYSKRKALKAAQTTPSITAPSAATQPPPTPTEAPTAAANTPAGVGPGNATIADNATSSNATSAGATSPTGSGANASLAEDSNGSARTALRAPASTHSKAPDESTASRASLPSTSASAGAKSAQTGAGNAGATSATPTGPEFVVTVKANKDSWVSSRADNKSTPGRLLPAKAEAIFRARSTLRLVIGNAGGVEISFNGKPLPVVGEENKSMTLVFTPAGPQQSFEQ